MAGTRFTAREAYRLITFKAERPARFHSRANPESRDIPCALSLSLEFPLRSSASALDREIETPKLLGRDEDETLISLPEATC